MDADYIQMNRINTQALPGPSFAPGVTIYGGGLVAPVGGWVPRKEGPFPLPEEPVEERPDYNFNPREVNSAANMLFSTREARPASRGWPFRWPIRRMQFDKGVTIIEAPGPRTPQYDILLILLAATAVYLVLKTSRA
jgi:hypothetical protein